MLYSLIFCHYSLSDDDKCICVWETRKKYKIFLITTTTDWAIRRWISSVITITTGWSVITRCIGTNIPGTHTLLCSGSIETWRRFRFSLNIHTFWYMSFGNFWSIITSAMWTLNVIGIDRRRWRRQISQSTTWNYIRNASFLSVLFSSMYLLFHS